MSKYEFAKRLKRMLANECEITQMETSMARKGVKYYEKMACLKTTLKKQEHELTNFRHEVDKIKRYNEKLEEFVQAEEDRLSATKQNVERLQKECEQAEQQQIVQRKQMQLRMDFIRSIKLKTCTYFNMDALPHRFQGVSLCKTESSCEWKPFAVDAQRWIQFLEEQWMLRQQEQVDVDSGKAHSEQDSDNANATIVI